MRFLQAKSDVNMLDTLRSAAGTWVAKALLLMLVVFRHDPPFVFQLLAALVVLVDLALLVFLFHPETSAYLRGAEAAQEQDEAPEA